MEKVSTSHLKRTRSRRRYYYWYPGKGLVFIFTGSVSGWIDM